MRVAWFGIEWHSLICRHSQVLASTACNLIAWDFLYNLSKAAMRADSQVPEYFLIEETYDLCSVRSSEVSPPAQAAVVLPIR